MLALLIIPVLVAGFLFCHVHPYYRLKLHRYEGQYLYLACALNGVKCFALALIFSYLGHYHIPNVISIYGLNINLNFSQHLIDAALVIVKIDDAKKVAWFFLVSTLTFASVFLLKFFAHLRLLIIFKKFNPATELTGLILEDSPLDYLLFKLSLDQEKSIMISMDDRKIYVGRIINLGEPSETFGMDQDIIIIPIMSGYRDKDTLKVIFTTTYADGNPGIQICLRQDSIVSATAFDFDAYGRWNSSIIIKP